MLEFSREQLEDMKAWAKDPKGAPFWETIKEMFADGVKDLRAEARSGADIHAARSAGHIDTLEEILDLPALIIQNHAEGKGDAKV